MTRKRSICFWRGELSKFGLTFVCFLTLRSQSVNLDGALIFNMEASQPETNLYANKDDVLLYRGKFCLSPPNSFRSAPNGKRAAIRTK